MCKLCLCKHRSTWLWWSQQYIFSIVRIDWKIINQIHMSFRKFPFRELYFQNTNKANEKLKSNTKLPDTLTHLVFPKHIVVFVIISDVFVRQHLWYLRSWLRIICVTNDHGYIAFGVIAIRSFPHSRLTSLFVTQRVLLVEQELFTRPVYHSSHPFSSEVRVVEFFLCTVLYLTVYSFLCLPLRCLVFLRVYLAIWQVLEMVLVQLTRLQWRAGWMCCFLWILVYCMLSQMLYWESFCVMSRHYRNRMGFFIRKDCRWTNQKLKMSSGQGFGTSF